MARSRSPCNNHLALLALGHAKITTTARYAHTADKNKIAAVKKLDRAEVSNRAPEA